MAAGLRTIKVKFTGDSNDLNRAAASSEKSISRWSGGMKAFGAAAATAGLAAGAALFSFAKDSVAAFAESEEAQQRLTDAFARFPSIADTNIAALRGINTELAKKTKFDDDALASGQAVIAQFGLTGKQLEDITPLLADYAAKTGQELPDAAEQLGKAFLGNTRALKELGINYKSTGNQAEDVANITELVRKQVGGFAEQQGRTAAGQAAILSNQFGELKEQAGEKLLPALLKLAEIGLKTVDWISQNKEIVLPLVGVIVAITAAQWAWNIAMSANPIGLIILAIAATIAAIILLVKNWDVVWATIKATALAVGRWFKDVLWGQWIKGGWDAIVNAGRSVMGWFESLPGKFRDMFMRIGDFIFRPVKSAFNMISDAWNNTVGRLSWTVPGWVPIIGGRSISAPRLPKFHGGGVVPGPMGREVMTILRAGEVVKTARQAADEDVIALGVIDLGEGITKVVEIKAKRQRRQLVGRVLAGAGAGR